MTSREWRSDRRGVFERDGYTCCNCSSVGGVDEPTAVRTYPVGELPLDGSVHLSSLVTVCARCFDLLQTSDEDAAVDGNELFRIVRRATRTQGETIAAAASFAADVTSLPTALESEADPATPYLDARRDVLLALDVVDTHLARIEPPQTGGRDDPVQTSLEAFAEEAATLQSELRTIVDLSETVVTGLGRCHGCFEPFADEHSQPAEAGPCHTCRLVPRSLEEWRRPNADGPIAFDRLFATINDQLQASGETTDALTDRATGVAEALASD